MGKNRRATNLAVVGVTGRYPFMFNIVVNMLNYYKRPCTFDDILLRNAYKESFAAHDQGKVSWKGCVKTILNILYLDIFAQARLNLNSLS